ncbi:MAG: hypothetical protein VX796_09205 [Pseudomonadota bacterium]|nr:hypothetical protein [Pseudomonadota bacterium]
MTTDAPIAAAHLRETARVICKGLPEDELHCHPAWRAADRIEQLEARAKELERQMLAGLQALGIGCSSIDQCAAFEREVRGTINGLEDMQKDAKAAGRAMAYRECAAAVLNGQQSIGDLAMHWKAQAARFEPDD